MSHRWAAGVWRCSVNNIYYMSIHILIFSAFFVLLGLLIWRFPKLIAGYNTMSAERQKKVDVKGLKRFMCLACCAIGVLIFVFYRILQHYIDADLAESISSIGIPVIGAVCILIGAQRYDNGR